MKKTLTNYTFDASAQTVTLNDYATIELERVLAVINVTDNIIIYNPADNNLGGSVATNVLTLTYDTTSMSNTDDLIILYDENTFYALQLDDTTTANITYVGEAVIGTATSAASWRIKKIDETSGLVITWADGNDNFDNIWVNRASLTYS